MKPKVKVGSIWLAKDMTEFKVLDVVTKQSEHWIHYQKTKHSNQTYSCLEPAFLVRFTEFTNC